LSSSISGFVSGAAAAFYVVAILAERWIRLSSSTRSRSELAQIFGDRILRLMGFVGAQTKSRRRRFSNAISTTLLSIGENLVSIFRRRFQAIIITRALSNMRRSPMVRPGRSGRRDARAKLSRGRPKDL